MSEPIKQQASNLAHRLTNSLRGPAEPRHYRMPLLVLVYLCDEDHTVWDEQRSSGNRLNRTELAAVLRRGAATRDWLPDLSVRLEAESLEALVEPVRELDKAFSAKHSAANSPLLRELFEILVEELFAHDHGGVEYYTPWSVARTMIELAHPGVAERVHDPCCGVGNLLLEASRFHHEHDPSITGPHLSGQALLEESLIVTKLRLAFEGAKFELGTEPENILHGTPRPAESVDVIVSNPPFGKGSWTGEDRGKAKHWRYETPPSGDPSFAWLQHVLDKLAPGGRAVVLMGEQAGFSGGANRRIRAAMLNDGVIEAVVTLPRGLFHATGVGVDIWILRKRVPEETAREKVLLIDSSESGRLVTRNRRELSHEEILRITKDYRDSREGKAPEKQGFLREVSINEIRARDWLLTPRSYLTEHPTETTPGSAVDKVRDSEAAMLEADERAESGNNEIEYALLDSGLREESVPIASDWEKTTLHEVCEVLSGPSGQLRELRYSSAGVPLVAPKNIHNNRITDEDMNHLDPEHITRKLEKYRIAAGDVLCVRTGSPGRPALVGPSHKGALFGTACIRLRPDTSRISGRFLTYWLGTPFARDWIARNSSSGTIPSLNSRVLQALPIRLPPLEIQHEVGKMLGALDEKIALHEEVIRSTSELRDSMTSMLGSGMFPYLGSEE